MKEYKVYLNNKHIDTVFADYHDKECMRLSLINHDGYDSNIKIVMPRTKNNLKYKYFYTLKGNYGYGLEKLTSEKTYEEIKERLKEYRENDRSCLAYKIVRQKTLN